MKRRNLINYATVVAASAVALPALSQTKHQQIKWKMTTSWPKSLDTLFGGAQRVCDRVGALSNGKFIITPYQAGEIVGGLEVLDSVQQGTVQCGHTSSYYYKGKNSALVFATSVPFGFTAQQQNAWLYYGGGQELWQKAYSKFNLVPMAAGNTGIQMAGWFNKEINSLDDLKGLKMRIPGLGGEVLKRAGGTPVNLPGGELFTALKTGTIDATEWVNPYNDLAFGLHKAAKYYYYPGWHEPGTTLECFLNKEIFDSLPEDLQNIITGAAKIANLDMLSEYIARNNEALKILKDKHKVNIMPLPDEVLEMLHNISNEVIFEIAKKDKFSMQVYDSYKNFQKKTSEWSKISIKSYLNI